MNNRCAPGFARLLEGFSLVDIENHAGVVYGLWPDGALAYVNPSWFDFARHNQGEPAISAQWNLGRNVLDAIPEVLKGFYTDLLKASPTAPGDKADFVHPQTHEYECSSPDLYRRFAMTLYNLRAGEGLLVVHTLQVERSHSPAEPTLETPEPGLIQDANGIVKQCAHCRRIQVVGGSNHWRWVPVWVEKPPAATSHTLCNFCLDHYYPADADETPVPAAS